MGIELFQLSSCRVLTNKGRDGKLRVCFRNSMEEVSANVASGAGSVKVVSPDQPRTSSTVTDRNSFVIASCIIYGMALVKDNLLRAALNNVYLSIHSMLVIG